MHWIEFGLKESEPSYFSFHLCLTTEIQQWHPASGLQQVREESLLQLWRVLSMSSGIIRILITAEFFVSHCNGRYDLGHSEFGGFKNSATNKDSGIGLRKDSSRISQDVWCNSSVQL